METSASFEARSAPSSYPTTSQADFAQLSRDPPQPGNRRKTLLISAFFAKSIATSCRP